MVGILNAFNGISQEKATGLGAVAGGISEALVTTAIGLFVAIPAVMMFNYLTGRVEAFDVEMDNSSSELIDYFLKRRGACAGPRSADAWLRRLELLVRCRTRLRRRILLTNRLKRRLGDAQRRRRRSSMAMAKRNEGAKVNSDINVTPMVDVMLVLLIIFMVITPMLQKGVSVDLAKVNNPEQMQDADKEDALHRGRHARRQSILRQRSDSRRSADPESQGQLANRTDKRVYVRRMRAPSSVRWSKSSTTSAQPAWIDLGLLTDQKKTADAPGRLRRHRRTAAAIAVNRGDRLWVWQSAPAGAKAQT